MNSRTPPRPAALPTVTKAAFGLGGVVEQATTTAYTTFVFFLYTGLLGLPGTLVGAATALALVVDAFADPILGSWSDNFRSRWGRRVPLMVLGAPIVALGLAMAFSPPAGFSRMALFAWLLCASLIMRFAMSLFHVPFIALAAELSDDYSERTDIVAWRTVFAVLGPLAVLVLGYGLFLAGPSGLTRRSGYPPLGLAAAAIVVLGGAISTLGISRRAAALPMAAPSGSAIHHRLWGELSEIFKNPSFRVLFAAAILFYIAQGVAANLNQQMNLYVWRMSSAQILTVTLAYFAGLLVGLPLAPLIGRRLEKRTVTVLGILMLLASQGGLSGLRAAGVFMRSGAAVVAPLSVNVFFAGLGVTLAGIAIASMMGDAADEHDYLFSARREGLYFAGLGFAGKTATGIGALLAGLALDAIRFPSQIAAAQAGGVAPAKVAAVAAVAGPCVALLSLTGLLLLFFYRIDRRRHAEVVDELSRRRAAVA